MLFANEDTYRELSMFNTLDELNESVRAHRANNDLNKTELAVLDTLAQYSCNDKHFGVSFRTKNNIAASIGKSRRTIIRVCLRLEALGIIRQVECRRKSDGQQTSNAIVIQPAIALESASVTQEPAKNVTPKNSISSLNSKNTKVRTVRPSWVPEEFFNFILSHFGNTDEVEDYWRAVYASTYGMGLTTTVLEDIGIQAFNAMKRKRRSLSKPIAYFVGAVKRLAKREYMNSAFNEFFDN